MIKTIKLRGVDVDVRELTVAQLDEVLSSNDAPTMIDKIFNPDMVSEQMLALCSGMAAKDLRECRPSELRPLVDAVREVNADFLSGMRSLVAK